MVGLKSGLVIAGILLTGNASAQESPMPEDLAWKLIEIGRVVDPAKTAALYAPMQQNEPYPDVKVERDLKYGTAERHLLDVFVPETTIGPRPVLIYVHGVLHRAIRTGEAGDLQRPGRLREDVPAAATQPLASQDCRHHVAPALRAERCYGLAHESRRNRRSDIEVTAG